MSVCISTPGKLFLLGEYAVLEGAPALLTAVDRRVQVTTTINDNWTLHAPDIGIDHLSLAAAGRLPDTMDDSGRARLRVFDAVRTTVTEYAGRVPPALSITITSRAFADKGHKLGLGSSAAVAGALTAALSDATGIDCDHATLCQLAIAAHRRAQNGAGSGADVATSIYGGVIEYQADAVRAQLDWPVGITGMAVITGTGASTPDLVKQVTAYGAREPARYANDMQHLKSLAIKARSTVADSDAFLALADDYFGALQALDAGANAGIVLPRHRQLATLAKHHGGVFKTTGAGGGDLGMAFAPCGKPAQQLASALITDGARIVPLHFGATGLKNN